MFIKLVGLGAMVAGMLEVWAMFNISDNIKLAEDLKAMKTKTDWEEFSKEERGLVFRALLKIPGALFEIAFLLLGGLLFPAPLKWALLVIAVPLPVASYLLRNVLPRPLLIGWLFLDHVACAAILIGGTAYYLGAN